MMKRILCPVLALCLLGGCVPAGNTSSVATAETAAAPTAAPQSLSVYYEAGPATAAAKALDLYAQAQGVELSQADEASQADLAVLNSVPAGDDADWRNMAGDELLSTAAIRAGVDAETAVTAVTALPLGKTLYGYWADGDRLAALLGAETDALAADLAACSWQEWSALAQAVTQWLDEPEETALTLNGTEYALPAEKPEAAASLEGVFTLPMANPAASFAGAAYTGALLAAGDSYGQDTLVGPLNGLYSALTLELANRDAGAMPDQAQAAAALQNGEALFYRGTMADLMAHTDAALQDRLVCLPFKCDFVQEDLSTDEYNLTGLMNYPVLSAAAWLAVPAGADEEGARGAAAAILWLYTSQAGEEALTESLGLITPWGTASNDTAACRMQVEQVGKGILPEVSLAPDVQSALAQAGIGLAMGEDGVLRAEFTRDDRTAWRDAAVAALEQSAQEDADETQS